MYVLCFTRPRYQVSVYRTIGPLVSFGLENVYKICSLHFPYCSVHPLNFMKWENVKFGGTSLNSYLDVHSKGSFLYFDPLFVDCGLSCYDLSLRFH